MCVCVCVCVCVQSWCSFQAASTAHANNVGPAGVEGHLSGSDCGACDARDARETHVITVTVPYPYM